MLTTAALLLLQMTPVTPQADPAETTTEAVAVEAEAMLGAAYDDVTADFSPRISLSDGPAGLDERVPLRPSLGLGLSLHATDRERPIVSGRVGLGPGGVTLRLVWGLDTFRPRFR